MRRKRVNYAKYGYIFCIPFVVVFLIFSFYPIIYTTVIGFTDLKGFGKIDYDFLKEPFNNFKTIVSNDSFQKALRNTIIIWVINFIPQILLALLFSAWFTNNRRKIKGQGFFKVMFYMPNIITASTIAILFNSLFLYPIGPVNDLLMTLGFITEPINFSLKSFGAKLMVAFIQFWMWYGYTMLILIAGILGINPELFEAAEIDGASGRQVFFRITLPNLRTIMIFTLVTSMVGGLNMFDIPKMLYNGGPDRSTLTSSLFIFNQAFSGSYMYNRAAAASMIMFVIIAILSGVIFYVLRDKYAIKQRKIERNVRRKLAAEKRTRREAV
jgi:cellobiose transport system permease protein